MGKYDREKVSWRFSSKDLNHSDDDQIILEVDELIRNMRRSMAVDGWGRKLLLGYDVGRTRDDAELSIVEELEFGSYNLHVQRLNLGLSVMPFKLQEEIVRRLTKELNVYAGRIDGTGSGSQLGENLETEFPQLESVKFTNENKGLMAKTTKMRLEDRTLALINEKKIVSQFHSIRRTVSEYSNVKYAADRSEGHHGDKFWAVALASSAGEFYNRNMITSEGIKVSGKRLVETSIEKNVVPGTSVFKSNGDVVLNPGVFKGRTFNNNLIVSEFFDTKFYG
jgi:phage FluMu gp28-like protein